MNKKIKFRLKMYLLWFFISLIILYLVNYFGFEGYLLYIVIFLLLKDLIIDLGIGSGNVIKRIRKFGIWTYWYRFMEHFPFVFLVFIFGIFGLIQTDKITLIIAFVDALIDFLDDFGVI